MTNEEKYKTLSERATAFAAFCKRFWFCKGCPAKVNYIADPDIISYMDMHCHFVWLSLEAEEEKPLPCPCCGSRFDRRAINWLGLDVCKAPELKDAELKPCPFCGGEAKLASQKYGLHFAYVKCSKCHAKVYVDEVEHLGMSLGEMTELAISEWNLRVRP